MSADHTVRSFDQELRQLEKGILELGELTAQQFAASLQSITARDTKFSAKIMESDSTVDGVHQPSSPWKQATESF